MIKEHDEETRELEVEMIINIMHDINNIIITLKDNLSLLEKYPVAISKIYQKELESSGILAGNFEVQNALDELGRLRYLLYRSVSVQDIISRTTRSDLIICSADATRIIRKDDDEDY